jgi:lipopolysaccharide export system protein LptA
MLKIINRILFFICTLLSINTGLAQDKKDDKIQVIHADILRFERINKKEVQYLSKDVLVRHKNTYLLCDSAIIEENKMTAIGHVRIVEGDSLQIFGDSLKYNGDKGIADIIGNIVLKHKGQELFTNQLQYNLKSRIASYFQRGILLSSDTKLKSKRGYYHAETGLTFFKDSVVVLMQDSMTLLSDSLIYHTKDKTVKFTGPTLIEKDSLNIYCERGYYNAETQKSYFGKNPRYKRGSQIADAKDIYHDAKNKIITLVHKAYIRDDKQEAKADSIIFNENTNQVSLFGHAWYKEGERELSGDEIEFNRQTKSLNVKGKPRVNESGRIIDAESLKYDGKKDEGIAIGNVTVSDTTSGYTVVADTFIYNKANGRYRALGKTHRAYIVNAFDDDSLYLSADNLLSEKQINLSDTFQVLYAWGHVKIWSKKLQGVCDSLYFSGKDSTFYLFFNPVMWSDTTQFVGDTILIRMAHKSLNDIFLRQKAFIINQDAFNLNNQLKGREIQINFMESKVNFMDVQGNAESVYFVREDEKGYVGTNFIQCSSMRFFFNAEEKVDHIDFYTTPKGNMLPIQDGKTKILEGYQLHDERRPKSLEEIIKKSGTMRDER